MNNEYIFENKLESEYESFLCTNEIYLPVKLTEIGLETESLRDGKIFLLFYKNICTYCQLLQKPLKSTIY